MRMLKWVGVISAAVILALGYLFANAYRSGQWVDQVLISLAQGWDADVIVRNARHTPGKPDDRDGLQNALNDLKRVRLDRLSAAACTHGLNFTEEEGVDFRSRCVAWADFDKGTVRFDFELKRSWNQWQITGFSFREATSNEMPASI